MGLRWPMFGVALALVAVLAGPSAAARAVVEPARALDGPVLDVGGAAMAPDGSGGIVYRKLVNGQPHVFVVRFAGGRWSAPMQADDGRPYPSTFPAIAAGEGGRLLVVWAVPWAVIGGDTHFQLLSAIAQPGARSFEPAMEIDGDDIGDGTAAYPALAMAPNGSAYVAYRVVTDPLIQPGFGLGPMRPGDEVVDVRVRKLDGGGVWSKVGLANRQPGQVTMRRPSAENAPAIGVGPDGNGLVVWQEPSIDGTARLWGRRIFNGRMGNVLAVSPDVIGGKPVTVDADAPAIAFSRFGQAKVAFRLQGGSGSPLGGPHVLSNALPPMVDERAGAFAGAAAVDGGGTVGAPSVGIDVNGDYRIAFTADGQARLQTGTDRRDEATTAIGGADAGRALVTTNPDGGGVTAWPTRDSAGRPVVGVRQDFPAGAWQAAQLSAPVSGAIDGLSVGESGLGDALIGFRQGPADGAQLIGAIARSAPGKFTVGTPTGWVRGTKAAITWEPAPIAVGPVRYRVYVDGHLKARDLSRRSFRLPLRAVGDGSHEVRVEAADSAGQQTLSSGADLRVDVNAPRPSARRLRGRRVQVRVTDPHGSGVQGRLTKISFGDGRRVSGRAKVIHRYKRRGRYVITVQTRDKVGNRRTWHLRVSVR